MDGGGNDEICPQQSISKNSTRGNTMRTTDHMLLTIWGNHISKIIENSWYQIADRAIKMYYGTKLLTTPMSIFEEIEEKSTLAWAELDISNYLKHEKVKQIKLLEKITSAKLIYVLLNANLICTNKSCRNKVELMTEVKIISCKRKCLAKECVDQFEGWIDVKSEDDQVVTLETDLQLLLNYFDIEKGDANLDEIENKLLKLEDVSITHNITFSKIVSITSHCSTSDFFEKQRLGVQVLASTNICG